MVSIDEAVRQKCPRIALGCVTGVVAAGVAPEALTAELAAVAQKIAELPEPKAVLESPAILATRRGYKALGKDPARFRGSFAAAHNFGKRFAPDQCRGGRD
jgi:DNA/RNA-binding domain of Phe-tRNA-synthetase-like protein